MAQPPGVPVAEIKREAARGNDRSISAGSVQKRPTRIPPGLVASRWCSKTLKLCMGSPGHGWLPTTTMSAGTEDGAQKPLPGLAGQDLLNGLGPARDHLQNLIRPADQMADGKARSQHPRGLADRQSHGIARRVSAEQSCRVGVVCQSLAMECTERRPVAGSREDQLVPAPETGLKMRQDGTDHDTEVSLGHGLEDSDRNSLIGCSQVGVRRKIIDRRAVAAVSGGDFFTHAPFHRGTIDGVVTPDSNADRHVFLKHTRRMQSAQNDG